MLHLTDDEVRALGERLGRDAVVETVESALRALGNGEALQPPKTGLHPSVGIFFHALPAVVEPLRTAGIKWVSYAPGNSDQGLPRIHTMMVLSDSRTGQPLCEMDALWLTTARTGACAAVAASLFSRPGAKVLTLVGGGPINRNCLPYLVDTLPELSEVRVVASTPASAQRHAGEIAADYPGIRFYACSGAEEGVAAADVVLSAIGEQPDSALAGEWLPPGALALPLEGEAAWDSAAFHAADRLIADDAAVFLDSFGRNRPGDPAPSVDAELAEVVVGTAPARVSETERIFNSNNGIGVLDVALARVLYDRAMAEGVGVAL